MFSMSFFSGNQSQWQMFCETSSSSRRSPMFCLKQIMTLITVKVVKDTSKTEFVCKFKKDTPRTYFRLKVLNGRKLDINMSEGK